MEWHRKKCPRLSCQNMESSIKKLLLCPVALQTPPKSNSGTPQLKHIQ